MIRIIKQYNTTGFDSDANIFKETIKKYTNIPLQISNQEEIKPDDADDLIHIYISNLSISKLFILTKAKIRMFMINHELFLQTEDDLKVLSELEYILARNKIGYEWALNIKNKYNLKYDIKLIKFTSLFKIIDTQKIWNTFLHSAGEHHWKHTDAIIKCWNSHPELPLIIITCTKQCYKNIKNLLNKNTKNILFYNYLLPYKKFIKIKNKIGIHLCPSIVEGFGHYINEARKVKSFVITSNLAPMNEFITPDSGYLIKCSEIRKKKNGSDLCIIDPEEIYKSVKYVLDMDIDTRIKMVENAHIAFDEDTKYFENAIKELFEKY
jgi:hypothetical protein